MLRHVGVAVATFCLLLRPAVAQEVTLDLSAGGATRDVAPGSTLRLLVTNRLPDTTYRYTWGTRVKRDTIPRLEWPSTAADPGIRQRSEACGAQLAAANKALKQLEDADTERQVPRLLRTASDSIEDIRACPASQVTELRRELARIESNTSFRIPGSFELNAGELLRVTIRRDQAGRQAERWEFVFDAGPAGRWVTSYGFTFTRDLDRLHFTRLVASDETDGDDGQGMFEIVKEKDRRDMLFVPSVLFHWQRPGQKVAFGPVGGAGYDFSNPVLFGGVGVTFRSNLTLTTGIVFQKRRVLSGRYTANQIVREDLDAEQLHTESYIPNIYVGIGLRLSSDPFKAGSAARTPAPAAADPEGRTDETPEADTEDASDAEGAGAGEQGAPDPVTAAVDALDMVQGWLQKVCPGDSLTVAQEADDGGYRLQPKDGDPVHLAPEPIDRAAELLQRLWDNRLRLGDDGELERSDGEPISIAEVDPNLQEAVATLRDARRQTIEAMQAACLPGE